MPSERKHSTALHFDRVSAVYDDAWFYDEENGPFQTFLADKVRRYLEIESTDASGKLADVGGGTGQFCEQIAARTGFPPSQIVCVDPSGGMVEKAKERGSVTAIKADALEFAASAHAASADKFLLKEVIHHIPQPDQAILFEKLRRAAPPGSRVCIITRKQDPAHYPFFEAARAVWKREQMPASQVTKALQSAGWIGVRVHEEAFPVEMAKTQWFRMVRNRFWSTFRHFSDDELEEGIAEIDKGLPRDDDGQVRFHDVLVFIQAQTPQ